MKECDYSMKLSNIMFLRHFVMTTDHLFSFTQHIPTFVFLRHKPSSSSDDAGNVTNNGGDRSFNSFGEMHSRFKGFVIDIEIWSLFVILIYFLHPIFFSTLQHFQKNINDNNKILNIHNVSKAKRREWERVWHCITANAYFWMLMFLWVVELCS